jgi:WD40 repeat protein
MVFISYAREDREFVARLYEALKARDHETWVDWQNIPFSAEWLQEIYAGIEAADTFVFVISPASVASAVCGLEIAHAVAHHKRLVPVVRRDVDTESVPAALQSLNWLFFREGDDFGGALEALLQTLDTDLEWVRAHTRLLTRALEWERKKRDPSLTLRGSDLQQAEQWLSRVGEGKQPEPTPVQTQYVLASRQDAGKRQRRAFTGVLGALIISLVLGALAWTQRNEAVYQGKVALARQLAAQGELIRGQRAALLPRSTLLAVEAIRRFGGLKLHSLEGEQSLRTALSLLARPLSRFAHEDEVVAAALSPDGKRLVTASLDRTARIWDVASGMQLARLTHDGPVTSVTFSPTGQYLATASWDAPALARFLEGGTTVRLWDAQAPSAEMRDLRQMRQQGVYALVWGFSPDGKYLFAGGDRAGATKSPGLSELTSQNRNESRPSQAYQPNIQPHRAWVWEVNSGREVARVAHENTVTSAAMSPDGRYLATSSYDKTVRIWSLPGGRQMARLPLDGWVEAVQFSPDGKYLAAATSIDGYSAHLWELQPPSSTQPVGRIRRLARLEHKGTVSVLAFSPDSKYLATAGAEALARVWEIRTTREVARGPHEQIITALTFSPDGQFLATASLDRTARVWDIRDGGELARITHEGQVYGVQFSPDGTSLATVSADRSARLWEANSARWKAARMRFISELVGFLFSPDGRYLAVSSWEDTVRLWQTADGREMLRLTHPSHRKGSMAHKVYALAYSPDGRYLCAGAVDGLAVVWEAATGREVIRVQHEEGRVEKRDINAVVFSPDSRYLVTAGGNDVARIWEVESGRLITSMAHQSDPAGSSPGRSLFYDGIRSVAFRPDGKLLATASDDRTTRVWDVGTGREAARLDHEAGVHGVAFSRDGSLLATLSSDDTTRVWEVSAGRQVALIRHEGCVNLGLVSFTPDGRRVVTGGKDGAARVWDARTGREVMQVRHEGPLLTFAVSPDGKLLATGSEDGTARVWTMSSGRESTRLLHEEVVQSVAFSPDAKTLAVVSDYKIWSWLLEPGDLIAEAGRRLTRNLTLEEWREYLGSEPYRKTFPHLP